MTWEVEARRPPLRGKALDILLVIALAISVAQSLALALVSRLVDALEEGVADLLGPSGSLLTAVAVAVPALGSMLLAFAVFTFLYCVLPAVESRLRDVWPGALVAAVGCQVAQVGFGAFLESFWAFDVVYAHWERSSPSWSSSSSPPACPPARPLVAHM